MKRIDNARLEALQRALECLDAQVTVIQSYKPLKSRHLLLKEKVEELEVLRNSLSTDSEGTTAEKQAAFDQLKSLALEMAKIGQVWAKEQQHMDLLQVLDLVPSDFNQAAGLDFLELARNVEQALRPHLEDLEDYEITATELDALNTAIQKSREWLPKPRLNIAEKKSLNENYRQSIQEALSLADDIESLLIGRFMKSHPAFVNQYLAASLIYDPHTRKTAIKIEVTNTQGVPLEEVVCDLLEISGEEQTTDDQGIAEIIGIRSGIYTLEIKKAGYQTVKTKVQVKKGQKVQIKLQLAS